MTYCKNCGVELEENANFCSLCGQPVSTGNSIEPNNLVSRRTEKKGLTDFQKLTQLQKRKIFWEIAGIILFSAILITSTINLVDKHSITWSKYSISIGMALFVNITLVVFLHKHLFLLFFFSFLTTVTLISLIDIYTGNNGWVTKLGIPLLLTAYLIVLVFFMVERKTKQKGLNIIAYLLIALGLLCVCIDGIISIYTEKYLNIDWSLTIIVSSVLISSLLLYIHHRLKRVTDLKRFFHL